MFNYLRPRIWDFPCAHGGKLVSPLARRYQKPDDDDDESRFSRQTAGESAMSRPTVGNKTREQETSLVFARVPAVVAELG